MYNFSTLTKYQILKVDAILNAVYNDLPKQITEILQDYKMVKAILDSKGYKIDVFESILKKIFTIAEIDAQLKPGSDSHIGWVIEQLTYLSILSLLTSIRWPN